MSLCRGDLPIINRGYNDIEVSCQVVCMCAACRWSSCLIFERWEAGGFYNFKISIINFKIFLIINAWQVLFSDPEVLWAIILKSGQDENKD